MNMQELKQLIYKGEKVDIECKEAENNVPCRVLLMNLTLRLPIQKADISFLA